MGFVVGKESLRQDFVRVLLLTPLNILRRSKFDPRPVYMGFVVDEVSLRIFSEYCVFPRLIFCECPSASLYGICDG
jgi:hypothetical protein